MIQLKEYVALSSQGPFLQINEDMVDVDLSNNLFMLLDGFGGSGVGDKGSQKYQARYKKILFKCGRRS